MKLAGMRISFRTGFHCKLCLALTVVLIFVIFVTWMSCFRLYWNDWNGIDRPHYACLPLQGRLANQMFQYAFMYAISRKKELVILLSESEVENILRSTFEIQISPSDQYHLGSRECSCFRKYEDDWDCAYDSKFEKLEKGQDIHVHGYFQSWKYWKDYEYQIRNSFRFQNYIRNSAEAILQNIVKKSGSNPAGGDVLIGIHIRRGDYLKMSVFTEYGYTTATEQYLHKATDFFRASYKSPVFIVCSNDIPWSRTALGKYNDVYFAEGNKPEIDMALLTLTNHTIMTVGTFGWWSAFLTNGTTLYYKHPFVPGSAFSKQFHGNTSEHFFPGWIGLD
ncbi:galactoside 2-alpha-L-fucosyltransferase 2-like [Pecten maximus]|uniref:galactoside 2-alpha-L-fucosyltransferase 2-like n=1 Tax=Pecten maximus TaxID=6579 RepID=UPI001458BD3E|nr:galactoside 2-alpha-L-fucosyltransferase 2-like [Pecten maximus]